MTTDIAQENTAFEHKAVSYERYARSQRDSAAWLAEWLPEYDVSHQRCLEFGAGTGLFTQYLVSRFAHVEASDKAIPMLQLCQAKTPGITVCQRDAWVLQSDRRSWDWVVSSSLLQWAGAPADVLARWRTLLKPHGRLLIGIFIAPSLPEMHGFLDRSPLQWRSQAQWLEIFTDAGFKIRRAEKHSIRYHYLNALALWRGLHGTGATVSQRMAPGQLRRILRAYEASFTDSQGVYTTWTSLRAELSL